MRDIIIIANFCRDFSETDNGRFTYLAKALAKENAVEIITSDFNHTKKVHRGRMDICAPYQVTFLHEPGYRKNISILRFFSHHVWGKEIRKYLTERAKPDVVYCAVPSLTGPNLVARYCEKNNIRFIIDVQDLWPEAFRMIVNISVLSDIGFAPFKVLANDIYKRADAIVAVSQTYADRAMSVNKKCGAPHVVYLGTELDTFDRYTQGDVPLKKDEGEVWLAYCGTLGASYDLTCVIDALALLGDKAPRFIVMGDGPRMEEFKVYAEKKHVDCCFMGRVPYDEMCTMLKKCDMAVNPICHNAAQSIINKHADYAASGLPVLNTQESQEYRQLVERYEMGFNCENGNAADLAEKIDLLTSAPELRKQMGLNARRCAEEKFDRENAYRKICEVIEGSK